MIYLDNAATTYPKPQSVIEAVSKAIVKYGANPGRSGHKMSMDSATEIFNARQEISDFFNANGPEHVIFALNCTHAINMVLKGYLKSGDHVVISCLEHNASARPLKNLEKIGVTFSTAKVYPGNDALTLNAFRSAITSKTTLVVCMHASNVWGIKLPIRKIASLAHQIGVPILVDAAQTAGIVPIDVKKDQLDYLCIAAHKGLYAPMGIGILIFNNKETLSTVIEGGTGTSSEFLDQPNTIPEKFESGTPNMPGIAGVRAGLKFVKEQKIERISRHEQILILSLYDKLKRMSHVRLYMPRPVSSSFVPLLSFNLLGRDSEEVASFLDNKGIAVRAGLHCSPLAHGFMKTTEIGTVRVCPSFFSTGEDIDELVRAIGSLS